MCHVLLKGVSIKIFNLKTGIEQAHFPITLLKHVCEIPLGIIEKKTIVDVFNITWRTTKDVLLFALFWYAYYLLILTHVERYGPFSFMRSYPLEKAELELWRH
jgi:hypothetical protein